MRERQRAARGYPQPQVRVVARHPNEIENIIDDRRIEAYATQFIL